MTLQPPRAKLAQLLGYWRDCVADEAATLAAGERALALPALDIEALAAGRIPGPLANGLFTRTAARSLKVAVALGRLAPRRRAAAADRPEAFVPLWIPALLTRAGELRPDQSRRPYLTRAVLDPTLEPVSIGRLDGAADFYARNESAFGSWNDCWSWAMDLWLAVVKEPLAQYAPAACRFDAVARVVACEPEGREDALLALLDGARERLEAGDALPLLERFAAGTASGTDATALAHGHLGKEPLSGDERSALQHALALREGDALVVTAAPGTGTLALVRSLVASLVVDAVARAVRPLDAVPPLIVLAASGRDAAAKWLETLSREDDTAPTGPRWISRAAGYAVHLAAGEHEASTADRGYPTLLHGSPAWAGTTAGPALAAERERAYLESFAHTYGHAALSLDDALAQLHAMTRECVARLEAESRRREGEAQPVPSASWDSERAAARVRAAEPFDAAVAAAAQELDALDEAYAQASRSASDWLERLDAAAAALEPRGWHESAFSWLESVAQHRRRRFADALGAEPPAGREALHSLRAWIDERRAAEQAGSSRALSERDAAAQRLERAQAERADALRAFDETAPAWDAPVASPPPRDADPAGPALSAVSAVSEEGAGELSERDHRNEAFRCAARYWEGRRLRELARRDGRSAPGTCSELLQRGLRSVAMLHPVAVATLPALAAWYTADGAPLYAALDALVVVDAEQIDVARAAAALPLAKRLIALGDPYGRRPVVQLELARARGNLRERFGDLGEWTPLEERGLLSYDRGAAGLLRALPHAVALTTQRTCAPEIVACCNELAYHGLRAVREAPARAGLPALGYAHVRGQAGASRVNEAEARVIVQFLVERREALLAAYPEAKSLTDVVAIRTPFRAQASFIAERLADALRACRMRAEPDLAIGTPFQVQTPVPLVMYSHVLEPDADWALVDDGPNLLALALWGATDGFFFFGDLRGLARRPAGSPSGVLAKHLLAQAANRLEGLPTSFYGPAAELEALDTPQRHLALFDEALATAAEHLLIVSPLAGNAFASDSVPLRLAELARRGVGVTIFSDREAADGLAASLRAAGVEWRVLDTIPASALAIDRSALYEGSFAWLGTGGEAGALSPGKGWLVRGPGAAEAVDELRRYYGSA